MNALDIAQDQQSSQESSRRAFAKISNYPEFHTKSIPLLTNIKESALADLMRAPKTLNYLKGDFPPNTRQLDSLLVVFSGKLWVQRANSGNSKNVTFHVREPRSGLAEIALITDELREVSVVALERAIFGYVTKKDFTNWLMEYPEVKLNILGLSAKESFIN